MISIFSKRSIAVFDLDGVLAGTNDLHGSGTINDFNFWGNRWANPEAQPVQDEMVEMAVALMTKRWHVIVLTARPEKYRVPTVQFLRNAGLFVAASPPEMLTEDTNYALLEMIPDKYDGYSDQWKHDTIKSWLDQGANIRFMVEDYPPNARAVRKLIPVLLYESVKP